MSTKFSSSQIVGPAAFALLFLIAVPAQAQNFSANVVDCEMRFDQDHPGGAGNTTDTRVLEMHLAYIGSSSSGTGREENEAQAVASLVRLEVCKADSSVLDAQMVPEFECPGGDWVLFGG